MNCLFVRSSWHAHCLSRVPLLYVWLSVCTQPDPGGVPRERLNLDTVSLLIFFFFLLIPSRSSSATLPDLNNDAMSRSLSKELPSSISEDAWNKRKVCVSHSKVRCVYTVPYIDRN